MCVAGPATLKDVAAAASVSVSTASRVLRGDLGLVGAETAARVKEAAAELNYHPSAAAQALVQGRTRTVGITYQYPHLGHYSPMLSLAADIVREYGYRLLHYPLHLPTDLDAEIASPLRERRVDILVLAGIVGAEHAHEWIASEYQQVVSIGVAAADDPVSSIPSACWSDGDGIRMAVDYLVSLGHRHLLHLGAADTIKSATFQRAVDAAGVRASWVETEFGLGSGLMAEGARLMRQALVLPERPTAVLARNDEIAIGALHAAAEEGMRVPNDISIMGYYDVPVSEFTSPSLSTVATPFCECLEAVLRPALQAACYEDEQYPDAGRVWFPTRLVVRKSTGPVPEHTP